MEETNSRHIALLIALLSLLLNIALIIVLFCIQDDIHQTKPLLVAMENEKHIEKKKENDIFFVDQLVSFGASPTDKKILLEQPNVIPDDSPNIAQQESIPENEPIDHSAQKEKVDEQALDETTTDNTKDNIEEFDQKDFTEESQQDNSSKIVETQKPLTATDTIFEDQNKKKLTKKQNKPKRKKSLSLSDIAKGYMRHAQQAREDTVEHSMQSLPKNKQMALYVYTTRLYDILEQTARVSQKVLYAPHNRKVDATLLLTINQDGELIEVHLAPQLHEKEIRDALLGVVNRAGLFPPIPKHLNKEKLTLSYPIKINMHEGFNTYSLGH